MVEPKTQRRAGLSSFFFWLKFFRWVWGLQRFLFFLFLGVCFLCVACMSVYTQVPQHEKRRTGLIFQPTPLAGSGLWMNNGWIQLYWNRKTFHTLCKANSGSKNSHIPTFTIKNGRWLNTRMTGKSRFGNKMFLDISECFTKP